MAAYPAPASAACIQRVSVSATGDMYIHTTSNDTIKVAAHARKYTYHLLVEDRHQVLFCYVPKVACTSWKAILLQLRTGTQLPEGRVFGRVHSKAFMDSHGLRRLSSYTEQEIRERLDTYSKIPIVRHPFERLLSAYHDKIKEGRTSRMFERFANYAVHQYRQDSARHSYGRAHV